MRKEFRDSINTALHNPNLTGALGRFSEAYRISREKAYEGIDFEAVRTQIAERKCYAASHLDELAEQFTQQRRSARDQSISHQRSRQGPRLHPRSRTAERRQDRRQVEVDGVGGNSSQPATWKPPGIEVRETDLGEWIIQLAGQTPSHMVMPAIHMTKEEVAEVFNEQVEAGQNARHPEAGRSSPAASCAPKFLNADMGITGANIAVAETGSLVIVTNEGNARLVTTLPKIHVAIVGIEKLMAEFDDIVPVLTALPQSATAQLLTSYVSIISGPVPNTDGTPKQLHIILMDNRRTEMSHDPEVQAGPAMHSLRVVPQRLSGVSPGRRTRLRQGLYRRHRHHPHRMVRRAEVIG